MSTIDNKYIYLQLREYVSGSTRYGKYRWQRKEEDKYVTHTIQHNNKELYVMLTTLKIAWQDN